MSTTSSTGTTHTISLSAPASRSQWAALAGRAHGHEDAPGRSFVFLHGLTFDCRMWDPILDALGPDHRAIALDLPGHGQLTSVLWLGITVLCAGYVVLGVAVISDGVRRTDHAIQIA